jgi:hypothetical protein
MRPLVQKLPAGHVWHVDRPVSPSLCWPFGHTMHALIPGYGAYVYCVHAVLTPPVQKLPALHVKHDVWPVCGWCVPAAHSVARPPLHEYLASHSAHDDWPVVFVYVPFAHATTVPLLHDDPIGQVMQLD